MLRTAPDDRPHVPLFRPPRVRDAVIAEEPLVIDWSKDTINWAKSGESAASFPIVEIADPNAVPFAGFDRLLIPYSELLDVVADSRYSAWQAALISVQGIYLIADSTTGKLYLASWQPACDPKHFNRNRLARLQSTAPTKGPGPNPAELKVNLRS